MQTGKGKLTFGKKTAQWVDDPAIAREIDTQHGLKGSGDVWVEQDENLEWHAANDEGTDGRNLGTHHYTFAKMGITLPPRESLIGKKKQVGGVQYKYVETDGKLHLVPVKSITQKRTKRASARREVVS